MKYDTKSLVFKMALSLFLFSVMMLFFVDPGSSGQVVLVLSAAIDLIICIVSFLLITAQPGDVISNEITIIVDYVELTELVIVADNTDMTVVDTALIEATPSPTTGIDPDLVYVWKINDVIVSGQGTDSLSFTTMTPGTYRIVASIGDLVSNEVTIVVDYPPLTAVAVTVDKTSVAKNEIATYTATLTPNAGTDPELIYYWFVNDTLVEDFHTSVFTWTTNKAGDYTVKCQVGIITSPIVTVLCATRFPV